MDSAKNHIFKSQLKLKTEFRKKKVIGYQLSVIGKKKKIEFSSQKKKGVR